MNCVDIFNRMPLDHKNLIVSIARTLKNYKVGNQKNINSILDSYLFQTIPKDIQKIILHQSVSEAETCKEITNNRQRCINSFKFTKPGLSYIDKEGKKQSYEGYKKDCTFYCLEGYDLDWLRKWGKNINQIKPQLFLWEVDKGIIQFIREIPVINSKITYLDVETYQIYLQMNIMIDKKYILKDNVVNVLQCYIRPFRFKTFAYQLINEKSNFAFHMFHERNIEIYAEENPTNRNFVRYNYFGGKVNQLYFEEFFGFKTDFYKIILTSYFEKKRGGYIKSVYFLKFENKELYISGIKNDQDTIKSFILEMFWNWVTKEKIENINKQIDTKKKRN